MCLNGRYKSQGLYGMIMGLTGQGDASAKKPMKQTASKKISPQNRREYDLIVIGGGINGTGIARDAAARGLDVLLVDKGDLGNGTTATSSRLIHGGLRYLEHKQIALVRESLKERERLLQSAPHLVRPMEFGIPVYEDSRRQKWLLRLGMLAYGLLSYDKSMPGFKMFNAKDFARRFKGTQEEGLKGGASYYDAQATYPERICVENAMQAVETGHADIRTHTRFDSLITEVEKTNRESRVVARGVNLTDVLTGESFEAMGKAVINAGGPWVDDIAKLSVKTENTGAADKTKITQRIGGTRGVHIVVPKWPDGPDKTLYIEARSERFPEWDGRPCFIIPWREDFYLIGTTDVAHEGSMDNIPATDDEIAYLLEIANNALKRDKPLERDDILYTTAGVRPLPYAGDDVNEGAISREHRLDNHAGDPNQPVHRFFSVVGGKLTTYRNLAESAVDSVVKTLKLRQPDGEKVGKSPTRKMDLPGGEGFDNLAEFKYQQVPDAADAFKLSTRQVEHLVDLYGSRYQKVLALGKENPDWQQPLVPGSPNIGAQVVYAVRQEFARTVGDVIRRMGANFNASAGLDEAGAVARLMGKELGWTDARIQREVLDYTEETKHRQLAFRSQNR